MSGVLRIAGCMSGTSCDGVDAVIAEAVDDLARPRGLRARVVSAGQSSLEGARNGLLRLSRGEPMSASAITLLRRQLSAAYVTAVRDALDDDGGVDVIVAHGQTVFHGVTGDHLATWQMLDAAVLAREIGAPVLHDLRSADVAAGGQGAPITPMADAVLFGERAPVAVVNLGGFCNATLLEADGTVRGFDVCPCNQLLDEAARRWLGESFDRDGASASAGRSQADRARAIADVFAGDGRSLGTGDERLELLASLEELPIADRLATLCDAVASAIASAVGERRVVLAGGGARNRALVDCLHGRCAGAVELTSVCGIEPEHREGACLAVLGALTLRGEAITMPGVTGCETPAPVSGSWALPPGGGWRVQRGGGIGHG